MSTSQERPKEEILKLIDKFKNAEASEEEIRAIDYWYDNPGSKAKYTDGMSATEKMRAQGKMLQLINERIDGERIPVRDKIAYSLFKKFSVAAILLLLFGGGLFFIVQNAQRRVTSKPVAVNVNPRYINDKALLTLGDGRKILLSSSKKGLLASQGNTRINKDNNGQIIYSTEQSSSDVNQYNTMETMKGGEYHLLLSDGTNVWLNSASSLTYPASFAGNTREVKLSGEAYFEVAHNSSHPFRVVTQSQTIEVLGTHFNVNAYENESSTKTTLLQGAVRVTAGGKFKILKPGQQAAVNSNAIEITDADTQEAVAWKDGFFEFTDADIQTIMRQISRWYDVDVTYEGKITKETFTGRVSKFLSIRQVLTLVQSPEVQITYEGRRVMVKN